MSAILKNIAGGLARSSLFAHARKSAEQNRANWTMPVGRWENLFVSLFFILSDYAAGLFPPTKLDRAAIHESEIQYGHGVGGFSAEEFRARELQKPFWDSSAADTYLNAFVRLMRLMESLGLRPGSKLLELGCGTGWMAEFLCSPGIR